MAPITVRLLKTPQPPEDCPAVPFQNQKYEDLRQQCLKKAQLFEDPQFPASPMSLGYSQLGPRSEATRGMAWRRPTELCQRPQFISQDMTRTDVCQGLLGNCWFLAAAASLSLYPKLMHRVVPPEQSFDEGYAGIFHFQFWQYGKWVDVIVDDRLPVKDGELAFLRSPEKEEFWAALLEKAYAKLNGSYEALNAGFMNEAFVDFTGGIDERLNLKAPPAGLFQLLKKAVHKRSLMGASLEIRNQQEIEQRTPEGLVKGHAYSVTGVHEVERSGRKVQLLRLRNPWGKVEWNGPWSDNSSLWSLLDPAKRAEIHVRAEDGEFWIQLEDFLRCFDTLELCHLTLDSLGDTKDDRWNINTLHGRWVRGHNAGGCRNNIVTFWTNPQFQVGLAEADGAEEPGCTLLVSLMQRERRQEKKQGREFLSVGFEIYQIPEQCKDLRNTMARKLTLPTLLPVAMSQYITLRDVTLRCLLNPGLYLIVPTTYHAMDEAKFTLRVFTEKQHSFREIDDEIRADSAAFQEMPAPPLQEEVWQIFRQFSGQDHRISALELQQMMNQLLSQHSSLKADGFSLESCQQAAALVDISGTGTLGLEEFKLLWSKIKSWELIFSKHDTNHSGAMDTHEIRLALEAAGFHLNNRLTEIITKRYGDVLLRVSFEGFLSCLVLLEATFRKCKDLDKNKDGVLNLTRKEWVELSTFA